MQLPVITVNQRTMKSLFNPIKVKSKNKFCFFIFFKISQNFRWQGKNVKNRVFLTKLPGKKTGRPTLQTTTKNIE